MSEASENEESPAKKRRGVGNAVSIMKAARLSGEEFVTTSGRLVEQKLQALIVIVGRSVLITLLRSKN